MAILVDFAIKTDDFPVICQTIKSSWFDHNQSSYRGESKD
jgi:hypothetical protein